MLRSLQNLNERSVLYLLITIALSSLALSAFSHYQNGDIAWWSWADGAFQNFSTEMMGAILTFALFELVVGTRKELSRLTIDLRSQDATTVQNALAQMRANGHLRDGSLNGLHLKGVQFGNIVLEAAILNGVNFENANLRHANLKNAKLREANFQNATLSEADLTGANLHLANLEGASLDDVHFDSDTILPNNKRWREKKDLSIFTDVDHPEFWLGYHLINKKLDDKKFQKSNLVHVVVTDMNLAEQDFSGANLNGAKFSRVNFRGSDFEGATLLGTRIRGCNLEDVNLKNVLLVDADLSLCKFNERTILPDGSQWIYGTDLERFTNPNHPEFRTSRD